jgi:hypothetical protein
MGNIQITIFIIPHKKRRKGGPLLLTTSSSKEERTLFLYLHFILQRLFESARRKIR